MASIQLWPAPQCLQSWRTHDQPTACASDGGPYVLGDLRWCGHLCVDLHLTDWIVWKIKKPPFQGGFLFFWFLGKDLPFRKAPKQHQKSVRFPRLFHISP